jgi:putative PIN family toxin of toxin-antitoxin system
MRYYAVIDTNVVVSAAIKWNSVPGSVINLAFDGTIIPLVDDEILAEYRAVLLRPKFHLTESIVDAIIEGIQAHAISLSRMPIDIDMPDPKDRVFFEVTMEARKGKDAYLVTGNIKHFPARPFVVTPRQMLNLVIHGTTEADES